MTKQELVSNVAASTGYTIKAVEDIMNASLEIIVSELKGGDTVRIAPLGSKRKAWQECQNRATDSYSKKEICTVQTLNRTGRGIEGRNR